jgi:hypothetical protein
MVPPPRFHLTRYAGVLASNAAMRAEVVPGRAKEVERNGVTNDDAQRELFGEERAQLIEENDSERSQRGTHGRGSCGACSRWRFSYACIVQASCASWRSRRRLGRSSGSSATSDAGEGSP